MKHEKASCSNFTGSRKPFCRKQCFLSRLSRQTRERSEENVMMKAIRVRNLLIGEGKPKICVPLVGHSGEEIFDEADMASLAGADMVELRCDFIDKISHSGQITSILREVRHRIGNIPLLFTFRSKEEGGKMDIDDSAYIQLCQEGIDSGYADMIDVELNRYERIFCADSEKAGHKLPFRTAGEDLVSYAKRKNIIVVMSNHDFDGTPEEDEILRRLEREDHYGADIMKIAVIPHDRYDVIKLLDATVKMSNKTEKPLMTISMSKLGAISRMIGEFTGSAITFAAVGETSAPGQMDIERMREILDSIGAVMEN